MKPNLTHPGKVIVTDATTGGLHGREANPALPEQPKDIIRNFKECYDAGASVAHIHVRDRREVTTADIDIYGEVVDGEWEHAIENSTPRVRRIHPTSETYRSVGLPGDDSGPQ